MAEDKIEECVRRIEIGTNSDTTYRFYDDHRKDAEGKERELHLTKCFDVVDTKIRVSLTMG